MERGQSKDNEEKAILTRFTTMALVHVRVSRGKKITFSLTDKVKHLDLLKQKPKFGCLPLAEILKDTYLQYQNH